MVSLHLDLEAAALSRRQAWGLLRLRLQALCHQQQPWARPPFQAPCLPPCRPPLSASLSPSLAGDASLSLRGDTERLLERLLERLRERLADLHALCPSMHKYIAE